MGERNCAIEGCNALEFRSSGYCLRHKDDHPWLAPPEVSLDPVPKVVDQSIRRYGEVEDKLWDSPFGWIIALTAWLFPPILLLVIPYYLLNRPTSKEDADPGGENPDANSRRDEDVVGENSGESQIPWWVIEEENQG